MSEIYADIYFLINFSMDLICLYITSCILKSGAKMKRLILGAALGGIYSLFALFFDPSKILTVLLTVFAAVFISSVSFGIKNKKTLFCAFLLFMGISFFMGGFLTYVYSYMGSLVGRLSPDEGMTFLLLPGAAFCAGLSYIISRISEKRFEREVSEITLIGNDRKTFTALVDTGNLLRDPIGGLPVIILSKKASMQYIKSGIFTPIEAVKYPEIGEKIRMIPVKTPKGEGMLTGFVPGMGVKIGNEIKKCCVAFSDDESFGDCEALLPGSLIK